VADCRPAASRGGRRGGFLGIFENTLASRAVTGFIAGAAGAFYTLPGLVSLAASLFKVQTTAARVTKAIT
jgi:hypothetical protein